MKKKELYILVSTLEALQIGLASDLTLLLLDDTLCAQIDADSIMEQHGFFREAHSDLRGKLYRKHPDRNYVPG